MTCPDDSGPPAGPEPPGAGRAARRWATRLAGWAIPQEILRAAPRPPWFYPPELFGPSGPSDRPLPSTPSTGLARAALPARGGSVLDVGCGGGRAGLALVPPAEQLTGVDRDGTLLAALREAAARRRVRCAAVQGEWPAVAADVEVHDVVVCHHVAYNVPELGPFGAALHARARRRVVMELRLEHPMVPLAPLWRQFWGLERPPGPTAADAVAVLREAGLPARQVSWLESPEMSRLAELPFEREVEITRIRLCLPPARDEDVAAALRALGPRVPRQVVTIWWDQDVTVAG